MKSIVAVMLSLCFAVSAWAKLPPLNDEAKAKAAEAAAKTAHNGKVDAYLLCKAQDKTAVAYYKSSKASGKDTKPATTTPPCADPGVFVYTPAPPATAASAVVTAAAPAAVAPAAPAKAPTKP
jgi:hypothetical protein